MLNEGWSSLNALTLLVRRCSVVDAERGPSIVPPSETHNAALRKHSATLQPCQCKAALGPTESGPSDFYADPCKQRASLCVWGHSNNRIQRLANSMPSIANRMQPVASCMQTLAGIDWQAECSAWWTLASRRHCLAGRQNAAPGQQNPTQGQNAPPCRRMLDLRKCQQESTLDLPSSRVRLGGPLGSLEEPREGRKESHEGTQEHKKAQESPVATLQ